MERISQISTRINEEYNVWRDWVEVKPEQELTFIISNSTHSEEQTVLMGGYMGWDFIIIPLGHHIQNVLEIIQVFN